MIKYISRILENFSKMLASERSIAQNTIYAYKNDIEKLLEHTARVQLTLAEINLKVLEDYVAKFKLNQGISLKTISKKISSIRQFFDFLTSEGGLTKNNIAVDLLIHRKSMGFPKAISQSRIDVLLQYACNISTLEVIMMVIMLEPLYVTSVLILELLTLKLQSLKSGTKLLAGYVIVKGKGNKERIELLNKYAREAFIKQGTKTDYLFPSFFNKAGSLIHLTRQLFVQIPKEIDINNAGINPNIHYFTTHMLQNGANLWIVQEKLLGHLGISSTQIYTKINNEQAANLVLQEHQLKDS